MRTLMRWAARLYPPAWRERYTPEFDALIDDISPSFGDLCGVLSDVLRVRATAMMDACLVLASASPTAVRLPVVVSIAGHALAISLVLLASWGYVTQMPFRVAGAPLPPIPPDPPLQVTDARIFPDASTLYSSLPLNNDSQGDSLPVYVANGVGINFLMLPDIGAKYRQGDAERRVWPGQALEGFIVRRVLPEYPAGAKTQGAVSVFVEYAISQGGSVKVLRVSGPAPFAGAAQSAIERWVYLPLSFENRPCEVISRIEVRFDSEFAHPGQPH